MIAYISAIITMLIVVGCKSNVVEPKSESNRTVEIDDKSMTLSEMKLDSVSIAMKGNNEYKSGEPLRFAIDTKGRAGYIYIIYEDSSGGVGVLYPNRYSPPSEIIGEHIFPDDFGVDPKAVTASRNCSDCKRDKTLLYAILTKKRISDIQNIDRGILHNILTKSKGIAVDFNRSYGNSGNFYVGVLEFYVK